MKNQAVAVFLVALVFMVPFASTQSTDPGVEDFERFDPGDTPSAGWYTYSNTGGGTFQVSGGGANGSNRSYEHSPVSGASTRFTLIGLDICNADQLEWYFKTADTPAAGTRFVWRFEINGNVSSGDSLGRQFGLAMGPGDTSLSLNIGPDFFDAGATASLNTWYRVVFTEQDCVGGSVRMQIPDLDVDISGTSGQIAQGNTSELRIFNQVLGPSLFIDEIILQQVEITNPAEFDTGFTSYVRSLGFITPASQMFLSIILVGAATVGSGVASKYVASGRGKNYIIYGSAALVGAFCTILGFIDLWVMILATVAGAFAVRGIELTRNTYFEIRDALEQRIRPEASEMEFTDAFAEATGREPELVTVEDPEDLDEHELS